MPLLPGERLNKRYRIVSLLAEGSYGAVYRAQDTVAGQSVAIKEYLDASGEIEKRFRQEARRLQKLSHPQLPKVLDYFALAEVGQYLVSEFIDGVDLQSLLEQYGPHADQKQSANEEQSAVRALPDDLITDWLTSTIAPLSYLHKQGQLHLNIKPANIRTTPDGTVYLVNMGLVGLGVRASGYGSPEQQAQQAVDIAADIYSLGATLYTLLTGNVPPNALSRESGLADLKPARDVNPDVAPHLSIAATRAMSIRPHTRFESLADFEKGMKRPFPAKGSEPFTHSSAAPSTHRRTAPISAPPALPPPPRFRPRRRKHIPNRTIYGLLGVITFLLALGFFYNYVNQQGEDATGADIAATATYTSAIIEAATALAPTPSPLPVPTEPPAPTPEPFVTDSGSRMIFVPSGLFRMGTEDGEADEEPSHLVRLDAYFMDETEVTNGQYALCVEDGVCAPPPPNDDYYGEYYGNSAFDNYPVIFVDWYDADTFCEWRGARLPSEAEWEKGAAFDPEQAIILRYPWGDAFDGTKVNFCDANCSTEKENSAYNDDYQGTAPVGSYPDGRSPIGLYDMAGNVMEWVSDWYDRRYYQSSTDTNPLGPPEGEFKALRGGSFLSTAEELPVYVRSSFDPTVARTNLGFRCAMNGN